MRVAGNKVVVNSNALNRYLGQPSARLGRRTMKKLIAITSKVVGILIPLALVVGVTLLFAFILMLIWNAVVPLVFGLPVLTVWQMWGIAALFGSVGIIIEIAKITFQTINGNILAAVSTVMMKRMAKRSGNVMQHFPFSRESFGGNEDEQS